MEKVRGLEIDEGDIRGIDHTGHAALAMSWEGTVEPNGIGVIDCYSEDVCLCEELASERPRLP